MVMYGQYFDCSSLPTSREFPLRKPDWCDEKESSTSDGEESSTSDEKESSASEKRATRSHNHNHDGTSIDSGGEGLMLI